MDVTQEITNTTHLKKETPRIDPFQAWKAAFKKAVTDKIGTLPNQEFFLD